MKDFKENLIYLNGKWKCRVVKEYKDGDFKYIPLEGCSENQLGKVFMSNKKVYFLSKERLPEPHTGGKLETMEGKTNQKGRINRILHIDDKLEDGMAIMVFAWKRKLYKRGIVFKHLPIEIIHQSFVDLGRVMFRIWRGVNQKHKESWIVTDCVTIPVTSEKKCCEQHCLTCGAVDMNGRVWRCCNCCSTRPKIQKSKKDEVGFLKIPSKFSKSKLAIEAYDEGYYAGKLS